MKKYIFFMLLLCGSFLNIRAQDPNCNKEIVPNSTDWRLYQPNNFNYPNQWNWTDPTMHPIYIDNNLSTPSYWVNLPYFCSNTIGMGSCGNKNTLHYEVLSLNGKQQDIYPEDGWELLVKNFGTPTIGSTVGIGQKQPYFVLYNRYNGKMKIYYAVYNIKDATSAYLSVTLDKGGKKRAVFAHLQPVAEPLIGFNPFNEFKTLCHVQSGSTLYWLVGEIPTAYDPCTCNDPSANSLISISPYLITVSTIDATIEGTITQRLANNGAVQSDGSGKMSFEKIVENAVNKGTKSFNQFEGFRKQAVDFLDKRNKAYKEKLSRQWWDANNCSSYYSYVRGQSKLKEFLSLDDNTKKVFGLSKIDKYNSFVGSAKSIAGIVPYAATAISVIDFLINGGTQTTNTTPAPIVSDVSLRLKGSITTPNEQTGIAFALPGSKPSSNNSLSPHYNRTLGIFNILKPPKMEYFELMQTVYDPIYTLRQYRFTEDIKYMLNPAAGLEIDLIDASVIFEYNKSNFCQGSYISNAQLFHKTCMFPISSTITWQDKVQQIEDAGIDLEYVGTNFPNGEDSIIRFRTKYLPLQCLKNMNFILTPGKFPKMYVKLLVKMKRKDNANAEPITNILTYDISESLPKTGVNRNTSIIGNYTGGLFPNDTIQIRHLPLNNPYYQYAANIVYENNNINNPIIASNTILLKDNTIVPENAVITSYGKIIVGKNVSFGNNVELIAGQAIEADNDVLMNPNITLRIDNSLHPLSFFQCTNNNISELHATKDEIYGVNGICQNKRYLDSTNRTKSIKESEIAKDSQLQVLELTVHPNPFNQYIVINYSVNVSDFVNITLTNSLGQLVKNILQKEVEKGEYELTFPLDDLPNGIYYLTIKNSYGIKTQKVLKTN